MITPGIEKPGGQTSTGIFNFNGGTLQATASKAEFLFGNSGGTALGANLDNFSANVLEGGAKIDTNGHDIGIGVALLHGGDDATDGGLTKLGAGALTLSANNTYTGATLVSAGTLLVTGSLGGTNVTVESGATLGGDGAIGGNLNFTGGSFLDISDLNTALTVGGTIIFSGSFNIESLVRNGAAIDWDTIANGTYTLISGVVNNDANLLGNLGEANAYDLGGGRSAYFEVNSLDLVVIPEPSAALLGGLAGLFLLRRRRG